LGTSSPKIPLVIVNTQRNAVTRQCHLVTGINLSQSPQLPWRTHRNATICRYHAFFGMESTKCAYLCMFFNPNTQYKFVFKGALNKEWAPFHPNQVQQICNAHILYGKHANRCLNYGRCQFFNMFNNIC
jgi:hypothetical protein